MPGSRRLSWTLTCLLLGAFLCVRALLFSASVYDVCLFSSPARVARMAGAQARAPLPAPTMTITPRDDLFAYTLEDFVLDGYEPWPHIKAKVAV